MPKPFAWFLGAIGVLLCIALVILSLAGVVVLNHYVWTHTLRESLPYFWFVTARVTAIVADIIVAIGVCFVITAMLID